MKVNDMEKPGILIIDDDIYLRKTLADILRSKGYETVAAGRGEEGLALFEENPVNLVFIDLMLPDIPGMKVLERIKTIRPSTAAIILTGNASQESAIEATNRGAFSYLLKPYEIDTLLLHAKRAIEKQQAEEEIIRNSIELQRSNAELKALYQVSQTLCRTIDMEMLLTEVLQTFMEMEIFCFERKGVIFLVEVERLRVVASVGLSEADLEPCKNIRLGECLCGVAALMGEAIISGNSREDSRHVICSPDPDPHGHIILPLKTVNTVAGVLCIYTRPDAEINGRTLTLLSTLGNQIGIAVNNARLFEEAKFYSIQDHLTGLLNRRSLQMQMEKCVEAAKRYGESFSVIMLDIDHFKQYNDTHGHVEGDRLLVELAGILLHKMRNADYVFRYGGEEFLVILPETDSGKAYEAAERLRIAMEAEAGVTISLGVATYRKDAHDSSSLIERADVLLYRAKQNGRNRVEVNRPLL
jgi:diguanylate cyclase (GGDEF)-like protein